MLFVGWSVGRVGWLVGRLVGRSVGRLVGRSVGRLVAWLVDCLVAWLVGWLDGWLLSECVYHGRVCSDNSTGCYTLIEAADQIEGSRTEWCISSIYLA